MPKPSLDAEMEYTKGKVMEESKPVAFMVHIPESRRGVKMDYVFYYKEDSVMLKSHRDYGDEITPLYAAYTFGNFHRKGCKYADDRMDNHITVAVSEDQNEN